MGRHFGGLCFRGLHVTDGSGTSWELSTTLGTVTDTGSGGTTGAELEELEELADVDEPLDPELVVVELGAGTPPDRPPVRAGKGTRRDAGICDVGMAVWPAGALIGSS